MSTQPALNASEEQIGLGDIGVRFLLTGKDTNGSMSIFEITVRAGQKILVPSHKNDEYEETLYGIQGVLTWTIDGKPFEVGPGQAVCIPRGAVHRFDNFGQEDVKQLAVISPAIMGPAYFHDVVDMIRTAAGGPPDPKTVVALFKRHGMTVAMG
jgi:quercetin dioxygenase-like cupin family protein